MTILNEQQIEWKIRSQLRTAAIRQRLAEAKDGSSAVAQAEREFKNLAQKMAAGVNNIEDESHDDLDESVGATIFGGLVSAAGIAKLMGYTAKGIAKILKKLGANVDPEKEGQTFFNISHSIHHFYIGSLEKLAGKMGVKKEKQKLVANVMFGVLLGTAATLTGIGLYDALKHSDKFIAAGEGVLGGIKAAEGAQIGTDIFSIFSEALEAVDDVIDVADLMDVSAGPYGD
jgi:hypothetical protein